MGEKLEKDQKVFDEGSKGFWWKIKGLLEEDWNGFGKRYKKFGEKIRVVLAGNKSCIGRRGLGYWKEMEELWKEGQRGIARSSERNWEKIMLLLVQYDEENRRGREIY